MMPYLAQEPKDHEASEAASDQAERDELDGMSGGWVRPGSHFSMMGRGLEVLYGKDTYARAGVRGGCETQQEDVFDCRYTAGYKTKQGEDSRQRYATCLSTTGFDWDVPMDLFYVMGV